MNLIEEHYQANRSKLVKRMTFRSGTEWDAEDIVQEAYARAIKYVASFDGRNFDNWFNTILNNSLREYKNSEKGFSTSSIEEEEELEGAPCNQYNKLIVEEIYEIINTKSENQIEVLTLFFQNGYTGRDIARITNHTYAATHQMIQRFRNELKELYK